MFGFLFAISIIIQYGNKIISLNNLFLQFEWRKMCIKTIFCGSFDAHLCRVRVSKQTLFKCNLPISAPATSYSQFRYRFDRIDSTGDWLNIILIKSFFFLYPSYNYRVIASDDACHVNWMISHLNTKFEMEPMQRYHHNFIKNTQSIEYAASFILKTFDPSEMVQVPIMDRKGVLTAANTNDTISLHTLSLIRYEFGLRHLDLFAVVVKWNASQRVKCFHFIQSTDHRTDAYYLLSMWLQDKTLHYIKH